jgi:hypothetical protein
VVHCSSYNEMQFHKVNSWTPTTSFEVFNHLLLVQQGLIDLQVADFASSENLTFIWMINPNVPASNSMVKLYYSCLFKRKFILMSQLLSPLFAFSTHHNRICLCPQYRFLYVHLHQLTHLVGSSIRPGSARTLKNQQVLSCLLQTEIICHIASSLRCNMLPWQHHQFGLRGW